MLSMPERVTPNSGVARPNRLAAHGLTANQVQPVSPRLTTDRLGVKISFFLDSLSAIRPSPPQRHHVDQVMHKQHRVRTFQT